MTKNHTTFESPKKKENAKQATMLWGVFTLVVVLVIIGGGGWLVYNQIQQANDTVATTTVPVAIDTDGDGLTNEQEALYGTNATTEDTDGDGYSDYEEVQNGFDPLTAAPATKTEPTITNETVTLPATQITGSLPTDDWQTYEGSMRSARHSLRYPQTWAAQDIADATVSKAQFLNEEGEVAIVFAITSGSTIDAAIISWLEGATQVSNEPVALSTLPGKLVIRATDAATTYAYFFQQYGSVYRLEALDALNEQLATMATTLHITSDVTLLPDQSTIVYHIAEIKDVGTSAFATDDTVENRFVRVNPDTTNPEVIYTITKDMRDGYGIPYAVPYDNNRILLFRRTESADDVVLLNLEGEEVVTENLQLSADALLSPTKQKQAYVDVDDEANAQTLVIRDTTSGDAVTIDASAVTGGTLRPLAWSSDEIFVYADITNDQSATTSALYRADLTDNSIIEIPLVRELNLLHPHILPDYNIGAGTTSVWSGDPRVGQTPPSTIERIALFEKTNYTLAQSETEVFGTTRVSPDGLWVAYEATKAGTKNIRLLSLADIATDSKVQLAGNLLDWTKDSKHIVYRTAKQIRIYTPGTKTDIALVTDSADSPTSADPYTIDFVGAFLTE